MQINVIAGPEGAKQSHFEIATSAYGELAMTGEEFRSSQ